MTLDQIRELRRQQGLRVANASQGNRPAELATYRRLDEMVRLNEGLRRAGLRGPVEDIVALAFDMADRGTRPPGGAAPGGVVRLDAGKIAAA